MRFARSWLGLRWLPWLCLGLIPDLFAASPDAERAGRDLLAMLDAPLLFVRQFNYLGLHIYDVYYKWRPGGGIYVLENPADPPDRHRVRAVIDPTTPETLGPGVYCNPQLSWDATRVLFCFKPSAGGSTSIYEIGIDGRGLRRLSDPGPCCSNAPGGLANHHDVYPAYLPDGRILFTSTRPSGRVPCANSGVDILHVMNPDGTGLRPVSVNNVNEFSPSILPDGRVLLGRWEYVDKTALTIQSLWTLFPDGTNETALYANNLVHPEAVLHARPVPGEPHLIVASLTPHNSPPRGSIAFLDTRLGKNNPAALCNLEHPDNPTFDRGESCEPWPLSRDVVVYSGRPAGSEFNAIMMIDRRGNRVVVLSDPKIDCHSPMLVKPRPRPPQIAPMTRPGQRTGRFFVQDIYNGLRGVRRGEVQWLRIIEETSRASATPGGAFNQTFLVSGVLAFSIKIFLGIVPVEPDGSAFFEAPAGRALYLQALDGEGRLVQSMRTFVQAAPGVTRSCIGCHEHKYGTPANIGDRLALRRAPDYPKPESWGSGFVDYPSMVQPVLDKHCVSCHGGEKGFAGRMDLSGGWTEYFNISYENLITRRETQLVAYWIAGIDCMNGTSRYSAQIFPPRAHGSGAAPLADLLVKGHKGYIPNLTRTERDLLMAWIDSNGLYHGTWDYTDHGCSVKSWGSTKNTLIGEMRTAGCLKCHGDGNRPLFFEEDWINLQRPELSRILRAPLAEGKEGFGTAMCRERKVEPRHQRLFILRTGGYLHADLPVDAFKAVPYVPPDLSGKPVVTFASAADPHYQAMLGILRDGRRAALAAPRADMPGAKIHAGICREFLPPLLPEPLPALQASADTDSVVHLSWERSARTIGLQAEVHRGQSPNFTPSKDTLLETTSLFECTDPAAPAGVAHYALILLSPAAEGPPASRVSSSHSSFGIDSSFAIRHSSLSASSSGGAASGGQTPAFLRSTPIRATVTVPAPPPPAAPAGLQATSAPGRVDLQWKDSDASGFRYVVFRAKAGSTDFARLTPEASPELKYTDTTSPVGVLHAYTVRAVTKRAAESLPAPAVTAAAQPEPKEPLFVAAFEKNADAALDGGGAAKGTLHGGAKVVEGALDLRQGGHATFEHRPEFDLDRRLSVELWVHFTTESQMPIPISCGLWNQAGWFLQRIGGGWRWHVGGIDCDGGAPALNRWTHLAGTFDGQTARLFQDGRLVAEKAGAPIRTLWPGPLHVGQYSGGVGPDFQVNGLIAGLRLYGRILRAEDAAAAAKAVPAPP